MCMSRGMVHHNLQWEDIFWLRWKVREKEVKSDFAEFLSLYSWSYRSWLLMALLIMWELNVSLDISFTNTHSFMKTTNQTTSGCSISSPTSSNHMTPHCQMHHTPNPVTSVYPPPPSSIFTPKLRIVITWCSDNQRMKWVKPESQTYTLPTGCERLWISTCKCSWIKKLLSSSKWVSLCYFLFQQQHAGINGLVWGVCIDG